MPLPADVRQLVCRVRSFRITGVTDSEVYTLAPEHGLASGGWATGPPGSAHLVHDAHGDALFVDVDAASGAWGRVFAATGVFHETWAYVAPSLVAWVTGLARAGLAAVRTAGGTPGDAGGRRTGTGTGRDTDDEALLERLAEASHVVSYRPDLRGTPVPLARAHAEAGADQELAAVLSALPDEALVVDLREVRAPATMHLPCPPALRGGHVEFQRRVGGRFAVGFPGRLRRRGRRRPGRDPRRPCPCAPHGRHRRRRRPW